MHCSPLIYVFPLISPLVFILSMVSDWFIAQIPCPASAAAFLRPCRWAPWLPWVPCIRMITFMTRSDESPGLRCPTVSHGVPRCPTVSHVWFMDVYGLWGPPVVGQTPLKMSPLGFKFNDSWCSMAHFQEVGWNWEVWKYGFIAGQHIVPSFPGTITGRQLNGAWVMDPSEELAEATALCSCL